jgi:uncharacterized protein with PIN domain
VTDVNKTVKVEPYKAFVDKEFFSKWSRILYVWSEPKSLSEGAKVVDKIKEPTEVTVVEVQKDIYLRSERARIRYGEGREGWVLYEVLIKK